MEVWHVPNLQGVHLIQLTVVDVNHTSIKLNFYKTTMFDDVSSQDKAKTVTNLMLIKDINILHSTITWQIIINKKQATTLNRCSGNLTSEPVALGYQAIYVLVT